MSRTKMIIAAGAALLGVGAASAASNLVVSKSSPELTLRVDAKFRALEPLRFPIENFTNAERRIFVDSGHDRVIDRMVVVQFERAQPGSDFRFVYPSTPPRKLGKQTYRFSTFAYDDAKAAKADRVKEAGRTRAFLEAAGYTPPQLYRVARMARVTDPDGLSEVIIFYMENADANPPTGAKDEDGDWILGSEEAAALAKRMDAVVQAVRG